MGYTRSLTRKKISDYASEIIQGEKKRAASVEASTANPADWRRSVGRSNFNHRLEMFEKRKPSFFDSPETRIIQGYQEGSEERTSRQNGRASLIRSTPR
jgi:hypothetical protein